jgi:hypothetical protein
MLKNLAGSSRANAATDAMAPTKSARQFIGSFINKPASSLL